MYRLFMPSHPTFGDFIDDSVWVADGVRELCEQLEEAGWYPRSRYGDHGIRYWPEHGRRFQYVIDLRHEMNANRLEHIAQHTGLELQDQTEETES